MDWQETTTDYVHFLVHTHTHSHAHTHVILYLYHTVCQCNVILNNVENLYKKDVCVAISTVNLYKQELLFHFCVCVCVCVCLCDCVCGDYCGGGSSVTIRTCSVGDEGVCEWRGGDECVYVSSTTGAMVLTSPCCFSLST